MHGRFWNDEQKFNDGGHYSNLWNDAKGTRIIKKSKIVQKNQEIFHKQGQFILVLISENNSLTNQCLGSLSKDINDLKESLEFSQNVYDDKFKNMGDKIKKLEEVINLMKEELHVIQTAKPSWGIKTDAKLVNLEDRPRLNKLRFEGIKEHESESWEDCEKNYELVENKVKIGYWKLCHRESISNREEKQEQITTYSCSTFILQGQDKYFKEF